MSENGTDEHGREINEHGLPVDSNGRGFDPDAGSTEPTEGRCNALLVNWKERYGEPRYCGSPPEGHFVDDGDPEFCRHHKARRHLRMQARDVFEHGNYCKSPLHFYDRVDPWQQVYIAALYESLLTRSAYDYDIEHETFTFDFSDADVQPSVTDDDGTVDVDVAYNANFELNDPALALFNAAADAVKMTVTNGKITADEMENEETTHAQLTSPTEDDPSQVFREITETTEHHLNLPYSRLVRDRRELLEYGGVGIDVDDGEETPTARVEYFEEPLDTDPVEPETVGETPTITEDA